MKIYTADKFIGVENVDLQAEIALKVDKETGKSLVANTEISKLTILDATSDVNKPISNATQTALDAIKPEQANAYTSKILYCLAHNISEQNITVLSDSTGNETSEWAYQLMQYLASKFPNVNVVYHGWNISTLVYNTPINYQTSTNPGTITLHFYIGGADGSGINYGFSNFSTLFPVIPNLVISSYGHNDNYSTDRDPYVRDYFKLTRKITNSFPDASLILIGQNPKNPSNIYFQDGLMNVKSIMDLCDKEGYGFINVMQRFFDYGDYLPLLGDDTHPNAMGQTLWIEAVKESFPISNYGEIKSKGVSEAPIFIGAGNLVSSNSSVNFENGYAYITLTDAVRGNVYGASYIPSNWKKINTYALWIPSTDATGFNVYFDTYFTMFDETLTTPFVGATEYMAGVGAIAGKVVKTKIFSAVGSTFYGLEKKNVPVSVYLERFYDHAGDTFTGNIKFLGILIEKAL